MLLLGTASTSVEIGEDNLTGQFEKDCEESWAPQCEQSSAATSWAAQGLSGQHYAWNCKSFLFSEEQIKPYKHISQDCLMC